MLSKPEARYLQRDKEKSNGSSESSNEDRLYELPIEGPEYLPAFHNPQPSQSKVRLKTYGRQTQPASKLSAVTPTDSTQQERECSAKLSQNDDSEELGDDQRALASTSRMQVHETPENKLPHATLSTAQPQRVNANLPSRPDAAIRRQLREESMKNTPIARRMERRRQQSRSTREPIHTRIEGNDQSVHTKLDAAVRRDIRQISMKTTPVAGRVDRKRQRSLKHAGSGVSEGKAAVRHAPLEYDQASERSATEFQAENKTVKADQQELQDSSGFEESLTVEEQIREARQNQLHADIEHTRYIKAPVAGDRSGPHITIEFESSDANFAYSSCGKDVHGLEESSQKASQQLQSLPDIERKQKVSFVGLCRHGNGTNTRQQEVESPESVGSESSNDEHNEDQRLDALDREILGLETSENGFSRGDRPSPTLLSSRSPKRRRPCPDRDSLDLYDLETAIEEPDDDGFGQPTPKKRRGPNRINQEATARTVVLRDLTKRRVLKEVQPPILAKSKLTPKTPKKSKKQPRSLPVDELVIVSERADDSDPEDDGDTPIELSENPISQLSLSLEQSHSIKKGKTLCRLDVNLKRGKGFGTIDISEFRIPEKRGMAVGQRQGTPGHSDGFEGREAQPIGRVMPLRKQNRRRPSFHKLTIRMGELKLVAERSDDQQLSLGHIQDRCPRKEKAESQSRQAPRAAFEIERPGGGDAMLADVPEGQPFGEVQQAQHQQYPSVGEKTTPQMPVNKESPLRVPTKSSPLEQTERRIRRVSFGEEIPAAAQPSQPTATQSKGLFRGLGSNDLSVSQQLRIKSAPVVITTATTPQRRKFTVDQQLMMGTIPRSSIESDDGDDDNDEESSMEDESESEEESESSEEERSDTLEEDIEEEGALRLDDEIEPEEQQEDVGMLEQLAPNSLFARASDFSGASPPPEVELEFPPTQKQVPTLRREEAQNPIVGMGPRETIPSNTVVEAPEKAMVPILRREVAQHPIIETRRNHSRGAVKTPLKQAPRRCSLRLSGQQQIQEDEVLLNNIDQMVVDKPQLSRKEKSKINHTRSVPVHSNPDDDSWRPREPITGSMAMEVEYDDIVNTPSPVHGRTSVGQKTGDRSRRLSLMVSQALSLVTSRSFSPQQELPPNYTNTQGSIELGDPQRLPLRTPCSFVPEIQLEHADEEPEEEEEEQNDIPTSQATYIPPDISYFQRASQNLQKPLRKPNLVRSKSMAASMRTPRRQEGEYALMADGIMMSGAFQHTVSPAKVSGSMPTLMSSSGGEKSLRTKTR